MSASSLASPIASWATRLGAGALLAALALPLTAFADVVIYDSIPIPLPPNVVSEGYECCEVPSWATKSPSAVLPGN